LHSAGISGPLILTCKKGLITFNTAASVITRAQAPPLEHTPIGLAPPLPCMSAAAPAPRSSHATAAPAPPPPARPPVRASGPALAPWRRSPAAPPVTRHATFSGSCRELASRATLKTTASWTGRIGTDMACCVRGSGQATKLSHPTPNTSLAPTLQLFAPLSSRGPVAAVARSLNRPPRRLSDGCERWM
jgi:hypothetical protein